MENFIIEVYYDVEDVEKDKAKYGKKTAKTYTIQAATRAEAQSKALEALKQEKEKVPGVTVEFNGKTKMTVYQGSQTCYYYCN